MLAWHVWERKRYYLMVNNGKGTRATFIVNKGA